MNICTYYDIESSYWNYFIGFFIDNASKFVVYS